MTVEFGDSQLCQDRWNRAQMFARRLMPATRFCLDNSEDHEDWISLPFLAASRAVESLPQHRVMTADERESLWNAYFCTASRWKLLNNLRRARRADLARLTYAQADRTRRSQNAARQRCISEDREEGAAVLSQLALEERVLLEELMNGIKQTDQARVRGVSDSCISRLVRKAKCNARSKFEERVVPSTTANQPTRRPGD